MTTMEVIQVNQISSCVPDSIQSQTEDMDLIEILWRQDIDLGIGKEVFDINLRRELEQEQEKELKEEEQKKKEEEKEDEKRRLAQLSRQNVHFVLDQETGERVPALNGQQQTDGGGDNLTSEQGLSIEEAIEILQEHTVTSPTAHTAAPTQALRQSSLTDELTGLLDSMPAISMFRQASMESRWNDVEDLIHDQFDSNATRIQTNPLPVTNNVTTIGQGALLHNTPFTQQNASFDTQYDVTQSSPSNQNALLRNATLGSSQGVNTTELLAAAMDAGLLGSAATVATPNSTEPIFNFNSTDTALFPNASLTNNTDTDAGLFSNVSVSNTTNFLLDLLDENNVADDNMPFHNSNSLFAPIKSEEQLSDSAIGSSGCLSPYSSDSANSNITSPFENGTLSFDDLEGATGGFEQYFNATKDPKTEQKLNFHSGSEDVLPPQTRFQYPDQSNNSDTNVTDLTPAALQRHVRHNHTYPALPGQQPKERKCDVAARMMKNKTSDGSFNRDEKRAKKLQLPFSVEDIIHSSVEKFNDMLTKYKLTEPQLQLMKDIRRRGKNKVAAQNCRKRKMEVIDTLEEEVERLRHERDTLQRSRGLIDKERNKVRDKYNAMYREIFNSLRDEHGQPYDPSEYTLQHTADGNVFLVPKNSTAQTDSVPHKNKKKRTDKK